MNKKPTQPDHLDSPQVEYRCSCGVEFRVATETGGTCPACGKKVSSYALQHEQLSMTLTISTLPKEVLGQTRDDLESTPVEAKNLIGESLGHFQILEPLGSGGQGQVYRALDKSLQRYVAVKVLQKAASEEVSVNEVDRLLQEAVAQARVTHPNIVTIYYVGKENGEPFLAMELVNGETISQRLSRGEMDFADIVKVGLHLTRALRFSYGLDIIHGDIKPSNVMLHENGSTKLSDFGMARRASREDVGAIGGTPNYLAPEVLDGASPSMYSDMYAMGVMFYEMTFQRLPIPLSGRSVEGWLETHREAVVDFPNPWPDNIPERWKDVLLRLLAKDPDDRFVDYNEMEKALRLVQPKKNLIARRAPRLIAGLIDVLTVMLFILPLQMVSSGGFGGATVPVESFLNSRPLLNILVYVMDIVPIAIYTASVFFWRNSIGRALMQLRVVNRYGLRPYRSQMAIRCLMRMSIVWMVVFGFWTGDLDRNFGFTAGSLPVVMLFSFALVNLLSMLLSHNMQSIHDRVFNTHVVVDTSDGD